MKNNTTGKITDILKAHLSAGLVCSEDILHFGESALGIADEEEMIQHLLSPEKEESGLWHLILQPGDPLRETVEPLTAAGPVSRDQSETIKTKISSGINELSITAPSGPACTVPITSADISYFVDRFSLQKNVPLPYGTAAMARRDYITRGRLLIRKARCLIGPAREEMILAYTRGSLRENKNDTAMYISGLALLLETFNAKDEAPPPLLLQRAVQFFREELQRILYFEEMSRKYSMDFLMGQKIHPPVAGTEEIERKLKSALHVARITGVQIDRGPLDLSFEIGKKEDLEGLF